MITLYHNPIKRKQSAELAAMQASQHVVPRQFAHGESGGKVKFQAGNGKTIGKEKAHAAT